MPRYEIREVEPIVDREENWDERCQREQMERVADHLGLEIQPPATP
jgi:hypothetical protein